MINLMVMIICMMYKVFMLIGYGRIIKRIRESAIFRLYWRLIVLRAETLNWYGYRVGSTSYRNIDNRIVESTYTYFT